MTALALATLIPGLFLVLLGTVLCWNGAPVATRARALPRSKEAAWVLFVIAAAWFIYRVSQLSEADLIFFQKPTLVMLGFAVLAFLSIIYTPDFLAVRALAILMLVAAEPLLGAAYMEWTHPQRLLMVTAVYAGISAALYFAAYPFKLRDFFDWLFRTANRPRLLGAVLLGYGLVTAAAAFTYQK